MTTVLDLMTNILSVLDSPSDTRMVLYTGVPYNLEGGEFSILIDRAFDEETQKDLGCWIIYSPESTFEIEKNFDLIEFIEKVCDTLKNYRLELESI